MYSVKVQDADGKEVSIEVSFEIYRIFEDERREWEREKKERGRHMTHRELKEDVLPQTTIRSFETIEDQVCFSETIYDVLASCTQNQRMRFYLYICGYSMSEIAKLQHCHITTVRGSIASIRKKIKYYR